MRRILVSPLTRPLAIRTRLAPGHDPWAPTRLLLDLQPGSDPRKALTLEFTDPEALRRLHRALGDLLADYSTYLTAGEHRLIRAGHGR
jgi:hypothetical protein